MKIITNKGYETLSTLSNDIFQLMAESDTHDSNLHDILENINTVLDTIINYPFPKCFSYYLGSPKCKQCLWKVPCYANTGIIMLDLGIHP